MKLSMTLNYSGDPKRTARTARDYESAGVDMVWVAELYSFDAVSLMGYLAAVTERMEIASGILPLYSRTPTLIGMTAAGLDAVSEGRFALGLGANRPPVTETWHGRPDRPPQQRAPG
jgi:alkanesulfonate monooxygenase SsuD/methylene tetrahydromethanopterin reductase-like flavin-dependent oxidoreductase (luciferase family)